MKREYGIILLPNSGGRSLPALCVSQGWVRVREDAARREGPEEANPLLERLFDLQEEAQAEERGVFSSSPLPSEAEVHTEYEVSDAKALVDKHRHQPLDAIVERVISGDRLLVRLLLSPTHHLQTLIAVAGIRTPSTRRVNSDGVELSPAEPFGDQAHGYVETRLLQRRVSVTLVGFSDQGQLIGSVVHPNGNIAHYLVQAGLGRCNDLHSVLLKGEMSALREAERAARYERKGIFKDTVTKPPTNRPVVECVVSRIINGDTLMVRTKAGHEKRISFSSVRQPKPSDPKQAPFAADAKEFLRKKLIGKHVTVTIDGKKPATEGFEEREVATVTLHGRNVTWSLLEAGYASVIRHRRDDDDRAADYDELLSAEELAQRRKEGMWTDKTPPPRRPLVDYSETLQKAKMKASVMRREGCFAGVVDFVKSGSRFTVLLPRDNAKLTFVLSGVRVPRSARNPEEASEPFGQEAHEFANRRLMQRDVSIYVDGTDKVGGFTGTLFVSGHNFAAELLKEGFATIHEYSVDQCRESHALYAAEGAAAKARKGLWHDWDPSKDIKEEEEQQRQRQQEENGQLSLNGNGLVEASAPERQVQYYNVTVTHVDPECRIKLQIIGDETQRLTAMMDDFRRYHMSGDAVRQAQNASDTPRVNQLVSAKFSEDDQWYRARVQRNNRMFESAQVVYVDYGNVEEVPWRSLRALPAAFGLDKLPAQAVDCGLSLVQLPPHNDYTADAIALLAQLTFNKPLVANRDAVVSNGKAWHVTLLDPAAAHDLNHSINAELVREGLAMAVRKPRAAWEKSASALESLRHLHSVEEEAKTERRGMWEYGDITED